MKKFLSAIFLLTITIIISGCSFHKISEDEIVSEAAEYLEDKYGQKFEKISFEWVISSSVIGIALPKSDGSAFLKFADENGEITTVFYNNNEKIYEDDRQSTDISDDFGKMISKLIESVGKIYVGKENSMPDFKPDGGYYSLLYNGNLEDFIDDENISLSIYPDDFFIVCEKDEVKEKAEKIENTFKNINGSFCFKFVSQQCYDKYCAGEYGTVDQRIFDCWLVAYHNGKQITFDENKYYKVAEGIYAQVSKGEPECKIKLTEVMNSEQLNQLAKEDTEKFIKKNETAREAEKVPGEISCPQTKAATPVYKVEIPNKVESIFVYMYYDPDKLNINKENKLYKYYAESGNAPDFYQIYDEDYDAHLTSLSDGEYLWIGTDATERN